MLSTTLAPNRNFSDKLRSPGRPPAGGKLQCCRPHWPPAATSRTSCGGNGGHFRGTQTGDLQSPGGTIPASGRDLNLRFTDYFRIADGKIVAHETVFDQMELLAQLGALANA
jgi:hypothetical protein